MARAGQTLSSATTKLISTLNGPTAQAMGDYVFTDATSGDEVRVEYTFGYTRNDDDKVRIYLHHSSVLYVS